MILKNNDLFSPCFNIVIFFGDCKYCNIRNNIIELEEKVDDINCLIIRLLK